MNDEYYMDLAYTLAQKANKKNDVPVGAVIVKNNRIIAKGFNKKEKKQNAIYHAEIIAINKACKKLKSFRLDDCTIYVTLEPCPMCCGAILNTRLSKICFGAYDKNYGCCGGKYNFLEDKGFSHRPSCQGGILEDKCSAIISEFFKSIRK